jgi:hypothetical protein
MDVTDRAQAAIIALSKLTNKEFSTNPNSLVDQLQCYEASLEGYLIRIVSVDGRASRNIRRLIILFWTSSRSFNRLKSKLEWD